MPNREEFHPDWISSPGDTINDALIERQLSVADFAASIGCTSEQATDLLEGRAAITIGVARQLERVVGGSVEFWMSRDFQYRQDSASFHAADEKWLRDLPVGDMIKFGWLKPVPRPSDEVSACLRFFGVSTVSAWRHAYAKLLDMVVFRTSRSFDSRPAAVAAWLRQGEIQSEAIECRAWDAGRFHECISSVRPFTRQKDPGRFVLELQKRCAEAGVGVVIVRAPNGCRASGATRFLSRSKALLVLSFRYLSDDQFWFSFFHEAAHLLLHGYTGFFLEGLEDPETKKEEEANEFAGHILIPPEFREAMFRLPVHGREVIRFARRVGVAPGVIVGQLQHFGRINHNQLNGLKRRFRWNY